MKLQFVDFRQLREEDDPQQIRKAIVRLASEIARLLKIKVTPAPTPEELEEQRQKQAEQERKDAVRARKQAEQEEQAAEERQRREAAVREERQRQIDERIGGVRAFFAEHRVKVVGALAAVGAVALAGALVPSGEQIPVPEPGGRGATPTGSGAPDDPVAAARSPTPKPGEWLIGEWVIDQATAKNCNSKMNIAKSDTKGFLRFIDPDRNKSEEYETTILSEGSLQNELWTYSLQSNGNVTMQLRSDPSVRLELSKCAG
jgi:hypothetical protein